MWEISNRIGETDQLVLSMCAGERELPTLNFFALANESA